MYIEEKPREQAPEGTHTAILYQIIDMGTQKREFNGDVKYIPTVRFTWELCEEKMLDGRPFAVSREYTAKIHEKAEICKMVKSWKGIIPDGKYNFFSLLGEACNISIVHNEKGYPAITAIAPLKKSEKAPARHNQTQKLWLREFNQQVFDSLPDFLKEKIRLSPEYAEAIGAGKIPEQHVTQPAHDDLRDEVPLM